MRKAIDRMVRIFHGVFMKVWVMILLVLAECMLAGCTTVSTRLPDLDAAVLADIQGEQERRAYYDRMVKLDKLMTVGSKVLRDNADVCDKTRPDIGVVTHTLKSYDKAMREAAGSQSGASDAPTVLYLLPGSPADEAGLVAGDQLLFEGEPVHGHNKNFLASLKETGVLNFKRNEKIKTSSISTETICAFTIRLRMTPVINAYADGRHITFTTGMMDFVESDAELALIVGHELAHNTHGHIRKIITNIILSGYAKRYTRPFEAEADYVGMYYMARAGFELDGIEDFWSRLSRKNPKYISKNYTHPAYPRRAAMIAATRDEINDKRERGEPLMPNPKEPS